MTEKPKTPSFADSLGDLLGAAQELLAAAPGAIQELAPLLPKELQAKLPKKNELPETISIRFRKIAGTWTPVQETNDFDSEQERPGDMQGTYRLVKEEPVMVDSGEPPKE